MPTTGIHSKHRKKGSLFCTGSRKKTGCLLHQKTNTVMKPQMNSASVS